MASKAVEVKLEPVDNQRLARLCGALDENLRQIESALDVTIARRGGKFTVRGEQAQRAARPDLSLTSDFIVGFPGETEADFEATLRLAADLGFDGSFSFLYSPRPGTPAANLPDDTPPEAKNQRLQRLQALLDRQYQEASQAMLGTVQRVLVESVSKRRDFELAARTANNRIVNFAGDPGLIGSFVDVRVSEVVSHSLRGELLNGE